MVTPLLALQVHRVQHLVDHLALGSRVPVRSKQPVGQGGLAVVDVGDDAEIADVLLVHVLMSEQWS